MPRPKPLARWPGARLRAADDAELVKRVRAGDESAFEVAYDRHHRGILSFCRHMLGSREEAEDAVQHTFIAAYRDLVSSDKRIQLKPWLYTIARNRCLSVLRARREQVALDDVEPATEGLSSQVQRRQDLREMLVDLAALPDDQREALVLAEIGALSHEEIAMTLNVRKEKVKALVFQARESLASSRQARDTDCREIQEQLAVLRGGSLRRTTLRRHVDHCPACAAYKAEVHRQRAAIGALLPVVPTLALKQSVLSGAFAAGGTGAAGAGAAGAGLGAAHLGGGSAGGGVLGLGAKGLAAKALIAVAVGGGATGAGIVASDKLQGAPSALAEDAPARLVPDRPGPERRDRGVAPTDGAAATVVGSLRGRATRVAIQRQADRSAAGTAASPGGGSPTPGPLAPAAAAPALAGLVDGEERDGGKAKGHDKDKAKGKAKGHSKDKGDRQHDERRPDGGKDRERGASSGNGRGDGPPPGQERKRERAEAPKRAPKRGGVQPPRVGGTRGGAKRARPVPPGRDKHSGGAKGAKPGQRVAGRVGGGDRTPQAPSVAPPAPPQAPQRGAEAPGVGQLVDDARRAVEDALGPRATERREGKADAKGADDAPDQQRREGGPVERAKGAVRAAALRLLSL